MRVLRDRLPELRVAVALAGPNVEVLLAGSPPTKSGTITERHAMLIGLGVGLLLGVLAALLLELLDDSIRTQQDLVRVAGADVPVLGTIPPTRSRDAGVVVLEQPASPAAEAYRSLRTAVLFAVADRARCIAITTATHAEREDRDGHQSRGVDRADGRTNGPRRLRHALSACPRRLRSPERHRVHVARVRRARREVAAARCRATTGCSCSRPGPSRRNRPSCSRHRAVTRCSPGCMPTTRS